MARQTDNANIMREIFTAELRANTKFTAGVEQGRFQRRIAERLPQFVTVSGQIVVILRRGQLRDLQRLIR